MVRLSTTLIGIINIVVLIASVSFIASSFEVRQHGHTECHKLFENVLLIFGGALFVISVLGLVGACCGVNILMWFYLTFLSLLIMGLIAFTVFTYLVTYPAAGNAVSGVGVGHVKTGNYQYWLEEHVVNAKNWPKVRSCVIDSSLCLMMVLDTIPDGMNGSIAQRGCCMPPETCGYTFVNTTYWDTSKAPPQPPNTDCGRWSNNPETLCYDCNKCKTGLVEAVRSQWKYMLINNLCILGFLIIVQSIATCAYHHNRYDRYKGYRGYH